MLYIEYSNTGLAVRDHEAQEFARITIMNHDLLQEDGYLRINISSEVLVSAFRVAVCRKIISHEKVMFVFNNQNIPIDKNGRIHNWPNGFCDFTDRFLTELLGG